MKNYTHHIEYISFSHYKFLCLFPYPVNIKFLFKSSSSLFAWICLFVFVIHMDTKTLPLEGRIVYCLMLCEVLNEPSTQV